MSVRVVGLPLAPQRPRDHPRGGIDDLFQARNWHFGFLLIVYLALVGSGVVIFLLPEGDGHPLVGESDWLVTGGFFPSSPPNEFEARDDVRLSSESVFWRSWTPQTGPTAGSVKSRPFRGTRFLAIPYYGFPEENPGSTIDLICLADGKTRKVAAARTNNQWSEAKLYIPEKWCHGDIRLAATSVGDSSIVAVGTPFSISLISYLKESAPVLVFLHLFSFVVVVAVSFSAAALVTALGGSISFYTLVSAVGVAALSSFFVSSTFPRASPKIFVCFFTLSLLCLAYCIVFRRNFLKSLATRFRAEYSFWFVGSLIYVLLLYSTDNGAGAWTANARFAPVRWSSDNQLSTLIAQQLLNGGPLPGLLGGWQVSDRPPLLAGFLVLAGTLFEAVSKETKQVYLLHYSYQIAGIVMNCLWIPVVVFASRQTGLQKSAWFVTVVYCGLAPFIIFNSVYIWPKLLGGAFAFLAVCALFDRWREKASGRPFSTSNFAFATPALLASLGIMSHSSMVFGLVGVGAWLLAARVLPTSRQFVVAAVVAATCLVPWLLWQRIVEPPGNALVKFALAGTADRNIGLFATVKHAYAGLSVGEWLRMKREAFQTLFGLSSDRCGLTEMGGYYRGPAMLGGLRIAGFLYLFPSLGFLNLGWVSLLFSSRRGRWRLSEPSRGVAAANISIATLSLAFTCLVTWTCQITVALPFLSILQLAFGLAIFLGEGPKAVRISSAVALFVYASTVWILEPALNSLHINAFAAFLFVSLYLAICVTFIRDVTFGAKRA